MAVMHKMAVVGLPSAPKLRMRDDRAVSVALSAWEKGLLGRGPCEVKLHLLPQANCTKNVRSFNWFRQQSFLHPRNGHQFSRFHRKHEQKALEYFG